MVPRPDYQLKPEEFKGFKLIPSEHDELGVVTSYKAEPTDDAYRCPACGSTDCTKKGTTHREWLLPSPGHKQRLILTADVPRIHCRSCGTIRQIDVGFALPKRSYTKAFAAQVIVLLSAMSVSAVAMLHDVNWATVNRIFMDWLESVAGNINLDNLRRIAIDETSIGKHHKYITIVIDLDTGIPIFVGEGKSATALLPFWELLGEERKRKIICVAMDMGLAYQAAVREHLPQADIVFDKFHVIQLVNRNLDKLRREEQRVANANEKKVFFGSRFLLFKNPENLEPERNEGERLQRLLKLNEPLSKMHLLSEDLREIWGKCSKEEARQALDTWINMAASSNVRLIESLGQTILRFKDGILAYYNHRVTSGVIEGVNNKVKTRARAAYGLRNKHFFRLIVHAIRELSPAKLMC